MSHIVTYLTHQPLIDKRLMSSHSHTVIDRSHHNESLLHNSRFSTEHKTLFFSDKTAAKEDTERVYALYYYCINLHFNEENQIWLYKEALLKELTKMSVTLL